MFSLVLVEQLGLCGENNNLPLFFFFDNVPPVIQFVLPTRLLEVVLLLETTHNSKKKGTHLYVIYHS